MKKIKKYNESNILVEEFIPINVSVTKRIDILVLKNYKPFIIIECKSYNTIITQKTFDQISTYNKKVKSPNLMISNGIKTFIFKINRYKKEYVFIKNIP